MACLQFLNKLAETAADRKERVHLQAEIEEAGFDVNVIKKVRVIASLKKWSGLEIQFFFYFDGLLRPQLVTG